jgi:hypothetical protein
MICRVQRSITPPNAPALIYNESRSFNRFVGLRDVERHFRVGELEFYAEIVWTNGGKIKSLRRLPKQNW